MKKSTILFFVGVFLILFIINNSVFTQTQELKSTQEADISITDVETLQTVLKLYRTSFLYNIEAEKYIMGKSTIERVRYAQKEMNEAIAFISEIKEKAQIKRYEELVSQIDSIQKEIRENNKQAEVLRKEIKKLMEEKTFKNIEMSEIQMKQNVLNHYLLARNMSAMQAMQYIKAQGLPLNAEYVYGHLSGVRQWVVKVYLDNGVIKKYKPSSTAYYDDVLREIDKNINRVKQEIKDIQSSGEE